MTGKQKRLVQASFEQVKPVGDVAASLFFGCLFEFEPDLEVLFTGDAEEQGRKLMQMVELAVEGLDSFTSWCLRSWPWARGMPLLALPNMTTYPLVAHCSGRLIVSWAPLSRLKCVSPGPPFMTYSRTQRERVREARFGSQCPQPIVATYMGGDALSFSKQ